MIFLEDWGSPTDASARYWGGEYQDSVHWTGPTIFPKITLIIINIRWISMCDQGKTTSGSIVRLSNPLSSYLSIELQWLKFICRVSLLVIPISWHWPVGMQLKCQLMPIKVSTKLSKSCKFHWLTWRTNDALPLEAQHFRSLPEHLLRSDLKHPA